MMKMETVIKVRRDDGFATVWMLGIAMLVIVIGLFFFNVSRVFVAREELVTAADASAKAGATAIDEDSIGSGVKLLDGSVSDNSTASGRCWAMLQKYEAGNANGVLDLTKSTCSIDVANPRRITVQAKGDYDPGGIFSTLIGHPIHLSVTSHAEPRCSDSTC
jgi:hypothetical protein